MYARNNVTLHLLHHQRPDKDRGGQFLLFGCAERLTTRREKDVIASVLCKCAYYRRLRIFGTYTMRRTYIPNDPPLTLHIPQTPLAGDKVRTLFIVFRGTHTFWDMLTDVRILQRNYHAEDLSFTTLRVTKDEVAKAVAALGLKPNVQVCLTGHSLGSAYALYQLRKLPPCKHCELIMYNPAVTKTLVRIYATHAQKLPLRGYLYRTESDLISYQYTMFVKYPTMHMRTFPDNIGQQHTSVLSFMLRSHKMTQFVTFEHVRDPVAMAAASKIRKKKLQHVLTVSGATTATTAGAVAGAIALQTKRQRASSGTTRPSKHTRKRPSVDIFDA